jgi:hypothetical protein
VLLSPVERHGAHAVPVSILLSGGSACEFVVTLADQVNARTLPLTLSCLEISLSFLTTSLPLEKLLLSGVQDLDPRGVSTALVLATGAGDLLLSSWGALTVLDGTGAAGCRPFTWLKSAVRMLDLGGKVEVMGDGPADEVVDFDEVDLLATAVVVVMVVVDELAVVLPAATSR